MRRANRATKKKSFFIRHLARFFFRKKPKKTCFSVGVCYVVSMENNNNSNGFDRVAFLYLRNVTGEETCAEFEKKVGENNFALAVLDYGNADIFQLKQARTAAKNRAYDEDFLSDAYFTFRQRFGHAPKES